MAESKVETTDEELLALIAHHQDQDGFARLYERYQRPGYSLALYITRDPSTAEEAFQEAMIKIWRSAGTYNGSGTIEAWIMRIIAHSAVQQLRGVKRKRTQSMADDDQACDSPQPHTRLAETELVLLLRNALVELSAPERELIALRFAAGMSQTEISRTLRIPQQTVSYRIDTIIKRLRTLLPSAEYSAVLPLTEVLREVILSGPPAPHGAYGNILKSIAHRPRSIRRMKQQGQWGLTAILLVIAAGAASVVYWMSGSASSSKPSEPVIAPAVPVAEPPASPVAQRPVAPVQSPPSEAAFAFKWNFADGLPRDFVGRGLGAWDKESKTFVTEKGYVIIIPYLITSKPIKITAEFHWGTQMDITFGLNGIDPDSAPEGEQSLTPWIRNWNSKIKKESKRASYVAYIWDNKLIELDDNRIIRVAEQTTPWAKKKMIFVLRKVSLESLEGHEVDEIPKEFRDIEADVRGLKPVEQPNTYSNDATPAVSH